MGRTPLRLIFTHFSAPRQPLDLTELEFPANLWIACHDIDDRNRQLAATAWEDNGLDVPEAFLSQLLPFLGLLMFYVTE